MRAGAKTGTTPGAKTALAEGKNPGYNQKQTGKPVTDEAQTAERERIEALAQAGYEADEANADHGKSGGSLDWDTIISRKGETRVQHINRHSTPNNTRKTHGVFHRNAVEMVNEAWEQRHLVEPLSDGMGGEIYNIPYKNAGYESGYVNTGAQMNYITIVTMEEGSALIAAFPSFGNYGKQK